MLELVLRGTLVYWLLFLIFRFLLRRDVGAVGIADILLLVIVADAAQNAMSGGYDTFTEGAILVLTIVGWNWLLDVLSFRFAPCGVSRTPRRLTLIKQRRAAAAQPAARVHHHGRAQREAARAGHREDGRREGGVSRRRRADQRDPQLAAAELTGSGRDRVAAERELRRSLRRRRRSTHRWPDATRQTTRAMSSCRSAASMTTSWLQPGSLTSPRASSNSGADPHGARAVFAHAAGVRRDECARRMPVRRWTKIRVP